MAQFTFAVLTPEQTRFIRTYSPENRHFTSKEEMDIIAERLGLASLSKEGLQAIRNSVVKDFDDFRGDDRDARWYRSEAMMSITAVIDHYIYS